MRAAASPCPVEAEVPSGIRRRIVYLVAAVLLCAGCGSPATPAVRLAVAANFEPAARDLLAAFTRRHSQTIELSVGSTGTLYAQIRAGAPFDLFFAADQERPRRLVTEGLGVAGSQRTYALGRLMLWSADANRVQADGRQSLEAPLTTRLAIANPELAPYGVAAIAALRGLGVYTQLQTQLAYGQNVAQAHAMVATGNAELGLLAASLVRERSGTSGSGWLVPAALHPPIAQDSVLLARAVDSAGARAFLAFVASAEGRQIVGAHGYDVPDGVGQ